MDARVSGLHVEVVGHGRPLVLLHGWALHAGLFTPLLPALARAHRVHAVDLPGHGHSAPPREWSMDAIVDALDATFGNAAQPPDVLGWSLGGLLALAWARKHPTRVRRLVLAGTTPKFIAGEDWPHAMAAETMRRFVDELRIAYRPTLQRFLTLQVQGSEEGRATLAVLRQALHARGTPNPSVLSDALHVLTDTDVRALVPSILQPTLVVAGERDTLAPPEASAWLARTLPDARLTMIPGAGHAPFLSHAAAFLAAVEPFLDL
jgi:pimeloyl-[acyl-carrier protein] methyl ester esterase